MSGRVSDRSSSPVVTVIVPVYNVEKYLGQAIQSVLNQTFPEWELLLIDDGSLDSSGMICDRYAEQDKRIHVYHTGNNGYGVARNTGLSHASGEWILFLDSDDSLSPFALESLLNHTNNSDLVMALYQTVPRNTMKESGILGGRFETVLDMKELFTDLYEPYFFLSVWGKLYRRSIIGNGFAMQEGQLSSEWQFVLQVLPSCNGIGFLPETIYFYRITDQDSVTKHFHSDWLYVSKKIFNRVISLFPDYTPVRSFMAQRYAYRVGQYLASVSLLRTASRIQKLAMIQAERADPFYQLPEISQAACKKRFAGVWKEFLSGNVNAALDEAEKSLHTTD